MTIPSWVSWKGLAEHAAIGLGFVLLVGFVPGPWLALAISLGVGIVHERNQRTLDGRTFSDFRRDQPGGPWNGILDVLFFCLPSLAWMAF